MCGVCGYVKGTKEVDPKVLEQIMVRLFVASQSRGRDATGFAYVDNTTKKLTVVKAPVCAGEFIEEIKKVKWGKADIFIGHTRAGTHGSPKNNENNHPIFSKESGMALTHNGIVRSNHKLKVDGEVDSEIILRLVERKSNVVEGIRYAYQNYWGSASFAIVGEKFPETLYLVRDGSPLVMAYVKEFDLILYASTEDILRVGLSNDKFYCGGFFSERKLAFQTVFESVEDDTLLVVKRGSKGELRLKTKALEGKKDEPTRKWSYGVPSLERHNESYGGQGVMFRETTPDDGSGLSDIDTESWREQE